MALSVETFGHRFHLSSCSLQLLSRAHPMKVSLDPECSQNRQTSCREELNNIDTVEVQVTCVSFMSHSTQLNTEVYLEHHVVELLAIEVVQSDAVSPHAQARRSRICHEHVLQNDPTQMVARAAARAAAAGTGGGEEAGVDDEDIYKPIRRFHTYLLKEKATRYPVSIFALVVDFM